MASRHLRGGVSSASSLFGAFDCWRYRSGTRLQLNPGRPTADLVNSCTISVLPEAIGADSFWYRLLPFRTAGRTREGRFNMALERELATYKAKIAEIQQHEGKFVLIHGDEIVDYFATYEDAIKEGYQKFSLEAFLVKQVFATEQIQFISRLVEPHAFQAL